MYDWVDSPGQTVPSTPSIRSRAFSLPSPYTPALFEGRPFFYSPNSSRRVPGTPRIILFEVSSPPDQVVDRSPSQNAPELRNQEPITTNTIVTPVNFQSIFTNQQLSGLHDLQASNVSSGLRSVRRSQRLLLPLSPSQGAPESNDSPSLQQVPASPASTGTQPANLRSETRYTGQQWLFSEDDSNIFAK